ncbi:MAG: retroviral-like aspartic protease family protein [Planctomycetes bacterium]|nr:retroviral-like aspartic protease family protein [Planctomycetota bacterium]
MALSLVLLQGCGGAKVSVLPLDGSFRANVAVEGKPSLLSLDTGAMCSDFYLDAAERLGLCVDEVKGRSVALTDSSGVEKLLTKFAANVHYTLGHARCGADYIVCLPKIAEEDSPGTIVVRTRIDGHLGMDVMQHFVFWFDAPSREMRVIDEDAVEDIVAGRGYRVTQRLQLGDQANRPMVRVSLNGGAEIELLLDTGAYSTCLPAGMAQLLSLPSGAQLERERREAEALAISKQLAQQGTASVKVTVGQANGSSVGLHGVPTGPRPLFHLRSLCLGNREVRDLVVVESAQSPILGQDVLAKLDWILHGPRRELWLLEHR